MTFSGRRLSQAIVILEIVYAENTCFCQKYEKKTCRIIIRPARPLKLSSGGASIFYFVVEVRRQIDAELITISTIQA